MMPMLKIVEEAIEQEIEQPTDRGTIEQMILMNGVKEKKFYFTRVLRLYLE
jgi:hypothetical protein